MEYSLAQLLEEQLPFLAAQWPAPKQLFLEENRSVLAGPLGPLHYSALQKAVRNKDRSDWFLQIRRAGAARAVAGAQVPALIAEALSCLNSVRVAVLGELSPQADEGRGVSRELDELETEVLAELVSGYFEGQERRADEQRLALEELGALFKINSAANSTLVFDKVLDAVVEHVAEVMLTDVCSLFIYEPEIGKLVLRATRGLAPDTVGRVRLHLGEGVTGWAALQGSPLALSDGWQDDRFLHVPGIGEESTKAILAVPIILYTKLKLVGVITLQSYDNRNFTDRDIRFLETVAGEVAIAIENARLHRDTDEQLRKTVEEMKICKGSRPAWPPR